jgi:catechol 2,3-dioxygenase-like lactoylglutathione lyase family enzyme
MSPQLDEKAADLPDTTTFADHYPDAKRPALHHVGLVTPNADALVDFYTKVLGAEINLRLLPGREHKQGPETIAFLGTDLAHHRLTIVELPVEVNSAERGKYARPQHVAWGYESIADLLHTYERLRDLGLLPVFCGNHGPQVYFFYKDPDGNSVELMADMPGEGKSREYYRKSEDIRVNNMGTQIDPEKMLAAWKADGLSETRLSDGSFAGEWLPETPWNLWDIV